MKSLIEDIIELNYHYLTENKQLLKLIDGHSATPKAITSSLLSSNNPEKNPQNFRTTFSTKTLTVSKNLKRSERSTLKGKIEYWQTGSLVGGPKQEKIEEKEENNHKIKESKEICYLKESCKPMPKNPLKTAKSSKEICLRKWTDKNSFKTGKSNSKTSLASKNRLLQYYV